MDWQRIVDTTAPEKLPDALLEATRYPGNRMWTAQGTWLHEHVPQDVLALALKRMMTALEPVNDAEDESPEGRLADDIRDAADVIWYALDEDRRR